MRASPAHPSLDRELEEAEMLAALVDGTMTVEEADQTVLDRLCARYGTSHVAHLIREARRAEAGEREAAAKPRSGTWGIRLAAAALLLIVAWFAWEFQGRGTHDLQVALAWPEEAVRLAKEVKARSTASGLGEGEPAWPAMRGGGAHEDLASRLVVVLLEQGFSSAVVLDDDGWLLTASAPLEEAVLEAAWEGRSAELDVRVSRIPDAPDRPMPSTDVRATVWRHAPHLGLSLLKLDDPLAGLRDFEPIHPYEGSIEGLSEVQVVGASAGGGELVRQARVGEFVGYADVLEQEDLDPHTRLDRVFQINYPFARGHVGGSVFIAGGSEPTLAGIVALVSRVGSRREAWCVGPNAIHAMLASVPPAPEYFPIDPWATPAGSTRTVTTWNSDGSLPVPALVAYVQEPENEHVSLFLSSGEHPNAPALPYGLPGSPSRGYFRFEVFLLRNRDGRTAIGTTNSDGLVDRIWSSGSPSSRVGLLSVRSAEGRWTVASQSAKVRTVLEPFHDARSLLWQVLTAR